MLDFEKLGAFYLGKRYDVAAAKGTDELVLYDSKDLTTHAVIIGMTGSGKTGLGIGILEEAAMDNIPVIAIDPKGDLPNLMLTFPGFEPAAFRPWVNPAVAAEEGRTLEDFAASEALRWKEGLADWGQDGARIARFREKTEVSVYTPGSSAGRSISVLKSFAAPTAAARQDSDGVAERVQATAAGLLSLLGLDTDPITSREHILVARILDDAWQKGVSLDLAALIAAIQAPPFERVGVLDLESFYPAKERFALALRLNNLLAAPGFGAWIEGPPLSAARLLYTEAGKPRLSILSIAHLDDRQRLFFVSMLLNELISWMREQQGTSSLRAILYMDEIFGYMPPTANPPTKRLLLTLLKQARAYGLGVVLATQNPVDLDYKGLSNTGTWFIGRLQTERDKARVMEGLEGAAHGGRFDRQKLEAILGGLGKRRFLLHNVHEDEAVVFSSRWVMSYLAGPMTRDQVRALMAAKQDSAAPVASPPPARSAGQGGTRPLLPPGIREVWLPSAASDLRYYPRLVAAADLGFNSARYAVSEQRRKLYTVEFADGPVTVDWDAAEALELEIDALASEGDADATYLECPPAAARAASYAAFERDFKRWLRQNETLCLFRSDRFRLVSGAGEGEGAFRVRLQQLASEKRDLEIARIRKRYAGKAVTLENRLLRAEQAIGREQQQAAKKKLDTAVSFGTAILSAVLGRKRLSSSSAGRMGTAIRSASGASKEAADVARAKQTATKVRADLEALNASLEREIDALEEAFDAQAEQLARIEIKPKATDIHIPLVALLWMPYRQTDDGRLVAAW